MSPPLAEKKWPSAHTAGRACQNRLPRCCNRAHTHDRDPARVPSEFSRDTTGAPGLEDEISKPRPDISGGRVAIGHIPPLGRQERYMYRPEDTSDIWCAGAGSVLMWGLGALCVEPISALRATQCELGRPRHVGYSDAVARYCGLPRQSAREL